MTDDQPEAIDILAKRACRKKIELFLKHLLDFKKMFLPLQPVLVA